MLSFPEPLWLKTLRFLGNCSFKHFLLTSVTKYEDYSPKVLLSFRKSPIIHMVISNNRIILKYLLDFFVCVSLASCNWNISLALIPLSGREIFSLHARYLYCRLVINYQHFYVLLTWEVSKHKELYSYKQCQKVKQDYSSNIYTVHLMLVGLKSWSKVLTKNSQHFFGLKYNKASK